MGNKDARQKEKKKPKKKELKVAATRNSTGTVKITPGR
jgi:hypothetical protein